MYRTYHAITTKIMKELPLLSDRLFKFLDINDDNMLTRSEFEIILSLFPQGTEAPEGTTHASLFQIMDVDETGARLTPF
jgi:Ca2+-binding EF-hand superfamily protein